MGGTDLSVLPQRQVVFPETVFKSSATTDVPLRVEGIVGQTAPLVQFMNNEGKVLTSINNDGAIVIGGPVTGKESALVVGGPVYFGQGTSPSFFGATQNIVPLNVNSRAIILRGLAGQTANIAEWQDSSGTLLGAIGPTGLFFFGSQGTSGTLISPASGRLMVMQQPAGAPNPVIQARGAASQTGNLLQLENNAGTVLLAVEKDGYMFGPQAGFIADAPGKRPLLLKGAASQTANMLEVQDSAGNIKSLIYSDGTFQTNGVGLYVNTTYGGSGAQLGVVSSAPGTKALMVRAASGTAAGTRFVEFQEFGGTVMVGIDLASFSFSLESSLLLNIGNVGLRRVVVGGPDSGGAGYRMLRIAN